MTIEIKMPALSPTMEKGTIAKWLVGVGDDVKPGDILAEIETDKATMEFEAVDEGRVVSLLVAEGTDDVTVGTIIAVIGDAQDAPVAKPKSSHVPLPAETASLERSVMSEPVSPTLDQPRAALRIPPADRVRISPLAARIAVAKGIDTSTILGSGPNGRIVRADLGLPRPAVTARVATPAAEPVTAYALPDVPHETFRLSGMRKVIARRLSEAKATVPHFYLSVHCRLDSLLTMRGQLNDSLATRGVKLSVNDMLLKALALALEAVPDANVQFGGDVLHRFSRVDIAMAVAIDGGLVTPVLTDVANKRLSSIATEAKALALAARDGKLTPEQYQGGTASLSNLGMFGIDEMVPVINPPQALILGVAAATQRVWPVDGEIGLATVMTATASFDHRAIDGAAAARFMGAFRTLVEDPLALLA